MPHRPTIPAAPTRNGHLPPDNHAALTGLALVLCLPLGLVALCHCRRVNRQWLAGDREAARRSSAAAHLWSVRALLVPAVLFILFMLFWGGVAAQQKFTPNKVWLLSDEPRDDTPANCEGEEENASADAMQEARGGTGVGLSS